ncbi:hypothetical protein J7F01_20885 [Streptomyces sp. ISL-22]|uniref:hypothetical protein n=1 Tax=unclassified Streptomyces TaxID=2593676 RepID=UPI001BEB505D|nr:MULTISPECIES: hypothetical protein [unclassified Streptomyces]MBT2417383.1 hypothetical protein [Streptomyces sp. ISL-24]MBT2434581.1 hypothetical protein [Streptomyces sp. ISL-22]
MSERMKPPARRTGRTLGGGAKKTTPPPPPPTAELTPEQFTAEQAADQGDVRPAASESHVQPAPSVVPIEESAQGQTETVPEASQTSARPSDEAAPSGAMQEPVTSQPVRLTVVAPEAREESTVDPAERQVQPAVPAAEPAAAAGQPTQPAHPVAQQGPSHVTPAVPGAAPAAEVAVRAAVPPAAGGTAFPVRTDAPGTHREQDVRSEAAPSEGTPWAQGPGRPKDIPETAVVLNQRIITRESLDSSVPAALKLKKRIKRFALDNELDHLPIGDIVSVALDEWLTARGF